MEGPRATGPISSPPTGRQYRYLANSLTELLETAGRELERDRELAKVSVARALSILQSETQRFSGASGPRSGGLAGWQTARVQAFVDENLHTTIRTSQLSVIAGLSKWHFSRAFKQMFGESPHAYVMRKRLERARHLMMTSSASLTEIALTVGFSDLSHLASRFRQAFDQSPSRWRREREIPDAVQSHEPAASVMQQPGGAGDR
jgi:AraC family transcriptional regulator